MGKTSPIVILLLVIALILSGCSGGTAAATDATQAATGNGTALSLTDKLAPGILKLEGTDLAVTAEQAAELLPLWKAVKSLGASDTATQLEIDAVYQQIQDALTAEQLAAIEALDLSGENMRTLMSELGIDMNAPFDTGLTDSERATKIAELRASGNMPQGGFGGGNSGGPGGGAGGGQPPSGGAMPFGGAMPEGGVIIEGNGVPPDAAGGMMLQGTPQPGQMGGRGGGMGFSNLFLEPLIKLLETRAGE